MDGNPTKSSPNNPLAGDVEQVAPSEKQGPSLQSPSALSENDWNLAELLDRLEGDQEFLHELLLTFRSDHQTSLQKAQRALAAGNLQELSRAAHTMKGMLRNLSMHSSGEIAAALEKSAALAAEKESAELLVTLENALAKIQLEVDAQLAAVKT
jgi:HPt (histidine-containing phosphotransfer) domain-containing protein